MKASPRVEVCATLLSYVETLQPVVNSTEVAVSLLTQSFNLDAQQLDPQRNQTQILV